MVLREKWCRKVFTRFLTSIVVLLYLTAFCGDSPTQAASKLFPVFDALSYKGKPDLTAHGMSAIRVIYEDELWNKKGDDHEQPNIDKITRVARTLKPGSIACIDIECWPVNDPNPAVARASIEKYLTVARIFKKESPLVRIGFYGVLPIRDHWRANGKKGPIGFSQWQKENDTLKPLAKAVDYIFPSLYTLDADPQYWRVFAETNIAEARRYGKPVCPFLWPQYHEALKQLSGQYLPKTFWELELDTCYRNADGIVVWGGYQEQWEENAPWWVATRKFLKSIH